MSTSWMNERAMACQGRNLVLVAAALLLLIPIAGDNGPAGLSARLPAVPGLHAEILGQQRLYFVENRGQVDDKIAYYIQGREMGVYFAADDLFFVLAAPGDETGARPRYALRLEFVSANPGSEPVGRDRTEAIVSYFKGAPAQWKTGLPTYAGIVYQDLWPGIDLAYHGDSNRLKYTFLLRPGADPRQIRLAYHGATAVALNQAGELEVNTPLGSFQDGQPVAYQEVDGQRAEVRVAYTLEADGPGTWRYGFELGPYEPGLPLVLDPEVLVYAGYIGGSGTDWASGIAVDGEGNAYVAGHTQSDQATFPDGDGFGTLPGPDNTYNDQHGYWDAFVAKVKADGTGLAYIGYIGGSESDQATGIAVDGEGNAYVVGWTISDQATFPDGDGFGTVTGPDLTYNGGTADAFVAKVRADGTGLVYVGYIGGSDWDGASGIDVDGAGNAYITGHTLSDQSTFPDGDGFGSLAGPDTTFNGSQDAFVARVKADGTGLDYAGYIGGSALDRGTGIAVDGQGNAYVAGWAESDEATFPDGDGFGTLAGPDTTLNGAVDAFVVKVKAGGTGLDYAGYIGGSGGAAGWAIAVDGQGNAYVTGSTMSDQGTFPDGDGFGTLGGPDTSYNGGVTDAFVAKVKAGGTGLAYCGYIGGNQVDYGQGIAVDATGSAYVTGWTESKQDTFPDGDGFGTVSGPDTTFNGHTLSDAFVVKVKTDGTGLDYAGYIGGWGIDQGYGIALDGEGSAYVAGCTASDQNTFPDGDGFGELGGPDLTHNQGVYDAFVAKISPGPESRFIYLPLVIRQG